VATVGDQVAAAHRGDPDVLAEVFSSIAPFGVLAMPCAALMLERCSASVSALATSALGVAFAALVLAGWDYAAFVVYAVYRTTLYFFVFAHIPKRFGLVDFGVRSGILFGVAGVVGVAQHALFAWAQVHGFHSINTVQLIGSVLLCAYALAVAADTTPRP